MRHQKLTTAGPLLFALACTLLLCLTPAAAAQFEPPDARLTVLTPQVAIGEEASVEVLVPAGLDMDLTLDWGDGFSDNVDRFGADVQTFEHSYTTAGPKSLELLLYDPFDDIEYFLDAGVIMVGSAAELDVFPLNAEIGELVTAEITAGEAAGRLTWGDGAFELLTGGDEVLTHSYAAPGAYFVELQAADGTTQATTAVTVTGMPLSFELPPDALVGEAVTAEFEGLAANAPTGSRLDWGDGFIEAILDETQASHTYDEPGIYMVRLTEIASGTALGVRVVVAEARGSLDLPSEVVMFAETEIVADDLTPGYAYEFDFGDGESEVVTADLSGSARIAHSYQQPLLRFEVTLTLVEGGQRTRLDSGVVSLELPEPSETLSATDTTTLGDEILSVTVTAGGLLPGVSYRVAGPQLGSLPLSGAAGAGSATFEGMAEGAVMVSVLAMLEVPGGGFVEVERASTSTVVAYPRGSESLAVEGPYERILDSDNVTVSASGLVSTYGYDLVVNGLVDEPYRLRKGEVAALPSAGEWRVELPLEVFDMPVTFDLYAYLPGISDDPLGNKELRTSYQLDATIPTGSLALPDPVVPYGVPSPVWVRELTPGLPYRLEFPNDRVETFVADDSGEIDFSYVFKDQIGQLELYVDRPGADARPLATLGNAGVTFVGRLGYTYDIEDYLTNGAVTMLVRGVAPEHEYVVTFNDGRRYEGTADDNGRLDLLVNDPLAEAQLNMKVFDQEVSITRVTLYELPPRSVTFHRNSLSDGWTLRFTSLAPGAPQADAGDGSEGGTRGTTQDATQDGAADDDFPPLPLDLTNLSGTGVVENFVIGGRLQDEFAMEFSGLSVFFTGGVRSGGATLVTPFSASLPQAVRGVELDIRGLKLGFDAVVPTISGVATLPTGETYEFGSVMQQAGAPDEGFMVMVGGKGPGLEMGASGWSFGAGDFGGGVLDLSTRHDYLYYTQNDGVQPHALAQAYSGYAEVNRPSPANAGGSWIGVLYPDGEVRMPDGGGEGSFARYQADVAWTSAGASTALEIALGDENGDLDLGGWRFNDVSGLELVVVDDQLIKFTRPKGSVHLDWFGTDMPVAFSPNPFGVGGWDLRTLAPVAHDYGSTAVVGGIGTFVRTIDGDLALRFPNALWALDGDLAADPSTIDSSAGDALLSSLPPLGTVTEDIQTVFDDSVATAETLANVYKLQLLLKDLTLQSDGGVHLGGRQWRTLAKVPALDMFGFPYLGAGAEIGVRHDEDGYAIGLRGELKLGELLEANAAPSWYVHEDGEESLWRFEGVGVKFGDFEESPVTFSVVVGGVIDLQRLALSFTGAGSLTIPDVLSIEVLGLFGVVEQDAAIPDFFWFVSAGVDLANMGRPINVNIQGVDVLAFYAFRGGIGSHIRLDVGAGECRVDDGNVPEMILPSIAANALDCYDPNLAVSFLGGTLIGSPVQGGAGAPGYGIIWHLDTNLVINLGKGGDLQMAGQGWIGKNLDDGYRQRGIEPEQLAGRLVINKDGITGTMCAGPVAASGGVIDCSGLAAAKIVAGPVKLAEFKGAISFNASWTDNEYYMALGTVNNRLDMYVIPRYNKGYFIMGHIKTPGILDANVGLPATGVWLGAESGFYWSFEDSGSLLFCDWHVNAGATFGFGGAVGLRAQPSFNVSASLSAQGAVWASAGGCDISVSAGASIKATGTIRAPNPTEFRGDFEVKIKLPVIPDIDVTVRNVGVSLN